MEIGFIGLGKMGLNITRNLIQHGISVVGYDIQKSNMLEAETYGVTVESSIDKVIMSIKRPRIVWLMLPSGEITNSMVQYLADIMQEGDFILDGGNSFYKDSIKNSILLRENKMYFYDVGTSGGIYGALNGGNYMIGGDENKFTTIEQIFKKISQDEGYLYVGESGSGHYLKMVHNGIEYGMMQAIAEGFDVLQHSPYNYNNHEVANLWNHGSVIRSWLMELASDAFIKDSHLENIKGVMYSSGEGKWTVEEALERQVSIPVISTALMMRYRSLENDTFAGKVVASLRKEFGGHKVLK